ncbi:MAG: hypothetical protein AAFZ65_07980 [Planctomycetota bacterium]
MLIALFLFIATLFGGAERIAERLDDLIDDEGRRAAATAAVERLTATEEAFLSSLDLSVEAFSAVHRDHRATAADYNDVFEPFDAEWRAAMAELIDARTELRGLLDEAEWAALFASE